MSCYSLVTNLIKFKDEIDDKFDQIKKCSFSKLKILYAASSGASIDHTYDELNSTIINKIESYQKFSDDLKESFLNEFRNAEEIKAKLHVEIQTIGDLKIKIEPTKWHINMDRPIRDGDKTVEDLIADCNRYRQLHKYTKN